MEYAAAIGVVVACAVVNRFRGGGFGDVSGARLYASIAFGLVAGLYTWDWRVGIAAALGFLFWAAWSWGRWFDLGRLPDDWNREETDYSSFERIIDAISFGSDHLAFFWRHAFGILPIGAALAWHCGLEWLGVIPIFAALAVLAYEMSHWFFDAKKGEDFIPLGEILTGTVWGALLLAATHFCLGTPWT